MKTFLLRVAAIGLLSFTFCSARSNLDPTTVPNDARWMLYVDVDALRENPAGKEIISHLENATHSADAAVLNGIHLDVKKVVSTLQSVTAYGTNFSKDESQVDGVLVLQGTDELRKIGEAYCVQASVDQPDKVTEVKDLPFAAYALKNEVVVGFPPESAIIISRSKAQLLNALEIIRGKGTGNRGESTLKKLVSKTNGLIVLAASEVPNTDGLFNENEPHARILKMATSASVAIGTESKFTTARVQLVAANDESSEKLLKIVQGLTAMLSLAETDDKDLTEFLRSVKAERNDRTIVLSLAFPSDHLVTLLRNVDKPSTSPASDHPARPKFAGTVVGSWTSESGAGQSANGPSAMTDRVLEKVSLKGGSVINLFAHHGAQIDFVEITPSQGGQPLRFEAENMEFHQSRAEKSAHASAGKVLTIRKEASGQIPNARFGFPGTAGSYTLRIRYRDDGDSHGDFTVTTEDPDVSSDDSADATPSENTEK